MASDDSKTGAASRSPSSPANSSSNPRSLRPHLFDNEVESSRPIVAGRIKPSDLMTEEDYARLRIAVGTRSLIGGLGASAACYFLVRRFWPRPITRPGLALATFFAGATGMYLVSYRYLMDEMSRLRKLADEMSREGLKERSQSLALDMDTPFGEKTLRDPFASKSHPS